LPTERRKPAASYIIIKANTAEIANETDFTPSIIATDVASALTIAECELGIPPVAVKVRKSNCFFCIRTTITFSNCAIAQAQIDTINMSIYI
jgi:hypothetical protein